MCIYAHRGETEGERTPSQFCPECEPDVGLDLTTPRSQPAPKPGVRSSTAIFHLPQKVGSGLYFFFHFQMLSLPWCRHVFHSNKWKVSNREPNAYKNYLWGTYSSLYMEAQSSFATSTFHVSQEKWVPDNVPFHVREKLLQVRLSPKTT